ncbi:protein ROOT PRIMORDIUM DEFECTIVE 1 [Ananas comosus]|uniref:Protein ROOT PRIMORDIUM DEFECTIVE 1 n=1 Tax=Ananas comosus TaxID=4615 RepID=A0A6P5FKD1_ANACO|nr:protein ROOT PRIMORDIUM DEFECTIVE 1 [Ananas comosus]XP_020096409.1 protein ROOT PRIMORDIUM DEFECTIVE 1 [Ananas comosus]XP_020096411.1 protein ROOT PRIMORDIUM DEFECTIVE 1 [Ananas comosus]
MPLPLLGRSWRSPLFSSPVRTLAFSLVHRSTYVDVAMKWKKDPFYDSIGVLARSRDLKPLVSLKSIIARAPSDAGIPVSAVSKRGRALETSGRRVASFLRRYPAVFDEYTGPNYNLPWFRLTREAVDLDREERAVYDARKPEIVDRLRRLILMSRDRQLPFRIVQGMLWYLGLPEDFLEDPNNISNGSFGVVEIGDGEKGLSVVGGGDEPVFSALQRNALRQFGGSADSPPKEVAFPLFPSKGLRLKRKIAHWLDEFQKLPYVSPYEDFSHLDPSSDISEKRAAGVLHELLSLFVDNSAERRRLLCLRKHLGLSQKFHKVFERHPHVFYLLLKSKTCFVVLKEAYFAGSDTALEKHPMLAIRKKYVKLMDKSDAILRSRRSRKPVEDAAEGS